MTAAGVDPHVTILDGGMGRQLARSGAPFRLPEWSALALIEAPHFVTEAHRAFIASGADIITTNSYAITPDRIGADRFGREGLALAALAGRLARDAARDAPHPVKVAGCLPPLFESYAPETFDPKRAPRILSALVAGLAPHVDFWLIETQSSIAESSAAYYAVRDSPLPVWVSYTLRDEVRWRGPAQLRSGESVAAAVHREFGRGTEALLFNCSQPEVMQDALVAAAQTIATLRLEQPARRLGLGVYANIFTPEPAGEEPYAGISTLREDVGPPQYLSFARQWVSAGASIVGGCCGVGPEHIALLSSHLKPAPTL